MLAIVIALNTIVFDGNYSPVKSIDLESKGLTAYSYVIEKKDVCYSESVNMVIDIDFEETIDHGNGNIEVRAMKPRKERAEINFCQTMVEASMVPTAIAEK